ncbi:hypothetical protein PFISCL1PPCAC_11199, partial [Pristionchus fissidentatus]
AVLLSNSRGTIGCKGPRRKQIRDSSQDPRFALNLGFGLFILLDHHVRQLVLDLITEARCSRRVVLSVVRLFLRYAHHVDGSIEGSWVIASVGGGE